jgi:branched-chain amino acid transport system ATP-binding protein
MSEAPSERSPAGEVLLQTDALVKRFGGLTATDHVTLSLHAGEVHALIGPNGAGKSTLIGQLSGEILPDTGTIRLAGEDVTRHPVHVRARKGLGRCYQITQVCREFTALENVVMAAMAVGGGAQRAFAAWTPLPRQAALVAPAREALATVGLAAKADVPAAEMAHGEHRQLELAMALALQPRLLLLDEPLAGMSGPESESMIALLRTLKARYPMLLVEHDMGAVFALADRISVLVYGRVIATGTPEAIRNDDAVRAAYLGDNEMVA